MVDFEKSSCNPYKRRLGRIDGAIVLNYIVVDVVSPALGIGAHLKPDIIREYRRTVIQRIKTSSFAQKDCHLPD